jgi:hypothetical protein
VNEVNGVRPSARTRRVVCAPLAVISGCSCGKVTGAQDVTYPAQGQTAEQRNRDRHDRHVWAVLQIGCNPSRQVAQASPARPPAVTTGPMRGAARGAVADGSNLSNRPPISSSTYEGQQSGSTAAQRAACDRAIRT